MTRHARQLVAAAQVPCAPTSRVCLISSRYSRAGRFQRRVSPPISTRTSSTTPARHGTRRRSCMPHSRRSPGRRLWRLYTRSSDTGGARCGRGTGACQGRHHSWAAPTWLRTRAGRHLPRPEGRSLHLPCLSGDTFRRSTLQPIPIRTRTETPGDTTGVGMTCQRADTRYTVLDELAAPRRLFRDPVLPAAWFTLAGQRHLVRAPLATDAMRYFTRSVARQESRIHPRTKVRGPLWR